MTYVYLLHHWLHSPIFAGICDKYGQGQGCGFPTIDATGNQLQDVLRFVFAILAALSVLFIVIAGFRLVTSQGDPQEVGKAKATIIYALIGLLVALIAEAIVAFVLDKL